MVGRHGPARFHAQASPKRSGSAKESAITSAGDWPRSTAAAPASSMLADFARRRCMAWASIHRGYGCVADLRLDCACIYAGGGNHHDPSQSRRTPPPRPVVLVLAPRPPALHQEPQRPTGDIAATLDAPDVMPR